MNNMTFEEIDAELASFSKTGQVEYNNKIIPGSRPTIGVRIPDIRLIAKKIVKDDYRDFVLHYKEEFLEDQLLKACVIGYAKGDFEDILELARGFVPSIGDWCVNDIFCQTFAIARKNRAQVWEWLLKLGKEGTEYSQRVAAVMAMSHFLVDEYIDEVFELADTLKNDAYYTKMGVAWCIATAYAKFPDKGREYMKNNELEDWTYNKSIQKMIESYRITEEDKIWLRSIKRK